jgi:gas vesicle protein
MNLKHEFFDLLPVKRKSTADWILPALAGLGVGIAVGACLGALYTPSTGEEARLRLREGAAKLKEKAQNLATRAKGRVETASEEVQGRLGGA